MAIYSFEPDRDAARYVGSLVGESTSREFRLAIAHEAVREQDIIAVDAEVGGADSTRPREEIRVWAKVRRIERLNPLFPDEAGHELAGGRIDPFDTVVSLTREVVTAVCQILGCEPRHGDTGMRRLDHVRYPPRPASTAYRPDPAAVARVVLGDLPPRRALDIATLANRDDVDVRVDGHAIVTRHLAILAMTGAGKSWAARRIIEELTARNYPIVIFDPHGDYTGLAEVPALRDRVRRYYAQLPIFEEAADTVVTIVETLGWRLANTHRSLFDALFEAARGFIGVPPAELPERAGWLARYLDKPGIARYGLKPDLFYLADFVQAVVVAGKGDDRAALGALGEWSGVDIKVTRQQAGWLEGLPNNLRAGARQLGRMEDISKRAARTSDPLPADRTGLIRYGGVSIVALSGYTGDFQAMIYDLVANAIFNAQMADPSHMPVLFVLEEAHKFAPAQAASPAEQRAVTTTRQIAQEGRKFNVGLVLISQRPSRLDETTLSQCNSYVVMRMVNPADQSYVRRVVETLGEDDVRMLPDLDVGEAILSGQLVAMPILVKMKEPAAKGEHEEVDAFAALEEAHRQATRPARSVP